MLFKSWILSKKSGAITTIPVRPLKRSFIYGILVASAFNLVEKQFIIKILEIVLSYYLFVSLTYWLKLLDIITFVFN